MHTILVTPGPQKNVTKAQLLFTKSMTPCELQKNGVEENKEAKNKYAMCVNHPIYSQILIQHGSENYE